MDISNLRIGALDNHVSFRDPDNPGMTEEEVVERMVKACALSITTTPKSPMACSDARLSILTSSTEWARHRFELLGGEERTHQVQVGAFQQIIQRAPLWFISQEATDLVSVAAGTVPIDTVLTEEMLVEQSGIAFFHHPIIAQSDNPGIPHQEPFLYYYNAIVWNLARHGDREGVIFILLTYSPVNDMWITVGDSCWFFGERLDDPINEDDTDVQRLTQQLDRKQISALWLLSSQDRLMTNEHAGLPRAAGRRAQRAGVSASPVRILQLRAGKPSGGSGESSVAWTHRWLVRGHWRNQAHGPRRTERRPVWIVPYVKGPEGLPLDLREGIRVL